MNFNRFFMLYVIFAFLLFLIWVNLRFFWIVVIVFLTLYFRALIIKWIQEDRDDNPI